MCHCVFAIQGQSPAADLVAKVAMDTCTFLARGLWRLWGPWGCYQGHWAPVRGLGSSSYPVKAASVGAELGLAFGTRTRSTGGPLHHALRLQNAHLRDVATFFQSPWAPSTEANWRTGCLRKKK